MSDGPVTEAATYTTKNQHKGRTSTPQAGFKPPNPNYQASADLRLRPRITGICKTLDLTEMYLTFI